MTAMTTPMTTATPARVKPTTPPSPPRRGQWATATFALFCGLLGLASQAAPPAKAPAKAAATRPAALHYNADIRPILAENCFACHGSDSASRKAGLRLDRRADALAARDGDPAAIVPGNPSASELLKRIALPDSDPMRMPPATGHKSLTLAQRQTLTRWISEGAVYEPHWAYIAPRRPALPAVKNKTWAKTPIDRFVLARLEANGLSPAAPADRRTLARRVSLDLTGLPPTPADVERFVADKSPNAYEKLVDGYLQSPHWGEHRGRYWLDAARYADTHGIHFDNYREMWSYRDWVINAFNHNMRFDQFTLEQLAGDLLPNPSLDQLVATGFNRCNPTTNEGGSINDEVLVMYDRDRTETTSQVFLATTTGCAVCHDHKFDPISQKDFYALAAFFNNTAQAAMDGNVKDTMPTMSVPAPADRARFEALKGEITSARQAVAARETTARVDFDRWLATPRAPQTTLAAVPDKGLRFHAALNEGAGSLVTATENDEPLILEAAAAPDWTAGAVGAKGFTRRAGATLSANATGDYDKDAHFSYGAWVKIPKGNPSAAVMARMDNENGYQGWDLWMEGNRPAVHIISKWPDNAMKVICRDEIAPDQWHHVFVAYDGSGKPGGIHVYIDGTPRLTTVDRNSLKGTIRNSVPFTVGQRHTNAGADNVSIQDVRVYDRTLAPAEVDAIARGTRANYLLTLPVASLSPADRDALFRAWLPTADTLYPTLTARVAALDSENESIRARGTVAHVWQEKPGEAMANVLYRGEYDKKRDAVRADVPAALAPLPAGLPRNRLGLARWLLLPQNPLTARVTVNRFWQEVWGAGLVRTAGDFGVMGELPTNPALLDYLAVDFRESGWDVKRFFKQMVMSAAYQQAATATPLKRSKDPLNKLCSRGPRFRMDAEMIRDYALETSGLLVDKIGGPSVRPYQPDGIWEAVAISGSNTRFYKADTGEALYRRSLYTFWKRSAPPASLDVFNAPSRETCTVRRERTDTPLQALVTLNDTQYVEAARHLAQRALLEGGATTQSRTDWLARRLLLRPLRPAEQSIIARNIGDLETFYAANSKDAAELLKVGESKADPALPAPRLAAWTMLVNQLLNLDEVLNK